MKMKKLMVTAALTFNAAVALAQSVTLYNTNIVNVENGKIVPNRTVTVKNGIIFQIEESTKSIASGQKDCTGTFLMPGLIDSHVHLGSYAQMPDNLLGLVNAYIEEGVTTIRDLGYADMRRVKKYQQQLKNGDIVGPSVYFASLWAGAEYFRGNRNTKGYPTVNAPWEQEVADSMGVEQLEKMIIEAKDFGCTALKLYHSISSKTLNRIVPLCKKHGIQVWSHFTLFPASAMDVVKSGVESASHAYLIAGMEGAYKEYKSKCFTPEEIAKRRVVFDEMTRRGTVLDATVGIGIGLNYSNPKQRPAYAYQSTEFTKEAYQAGVKIAAGTDFAYMNMGKIESALMDELKLLKDSCGMSIPDVLRAATTVGAELVGKTGKLGVIKEGAEADLLVLRSNPLESLDALHDRATLYIDGKEVKGINKGFGVGKPAPDFTYSDINGKKVSLKDFRGKYVFIDVWASWCRPCRTEIPSIKKLEESLMGKNIVFVSLSCDKKEADWRKAVEQEQLKGIVLHTGGDKAFLDAFNVVSIPRFILIDKEGMILNGSMTYPSNPETGKTLRSLEGL